MTTVTIYSDTADGYCNSSSTSYTSASNGTGIGASPAAAVGYVGQYIIGGTTYVVHLGYLKFDTSSIPDDAEITSVTLSCYGYNDLSTTDFTVEARLHDWGASLTSADWIAGSALSGKTLLASRSSLGWNTSGYNTFTENGSNFRNNINKTGTTYIVLCSAEHTAQSPPTNDEYIGLYFSDETGTSKDPKLEITYSTAHTKSVSGTMGALSGTLTKGHAYTKAIAGAISSITSAITKVTNKAVSGSSGIVSGDNSKLITKSFSGAAGALSGAVSSAAVILHQISGTMGALSGTVSDLQTGFGANLTGAVGSMSGSISRSIGKSVSGTLTASGNVFKMNTFRFAIMKAGTVVRKVIQGGRDY